LVDVFVRFLAAGADQRDQEQENSDQHLRWHSIAFVMEGAAWAELVTIMF
jgi:hypothetical protein